MAQKISPETKVSRAGHVLDTVVDETTILMSTKSGNYIEFNQTSSAIWSMIDGGNDIAAIVDGLCETFEVQRSQCEEQALAFVDELLREELVLVN